MSKNKKLKKRGFVMTGGGAKGLYEAGVIHAFHITGMEFDVITGSSIGAMNSIFFAEYLYRKRQLNPELRGDYTRAVEEMDDMVKAFHHAWLTMPDARIVDDSEEGPLGQVVDDLKNFDISLPQLVELYWWSTDPDRGSIPSPKLWPAISKLVLELGERLGGIGAALNLIKFNRQAVFNAAIRAYLARFGVVVSLAPPQDDQNLRGVFTEPIKPLRLENLKGVITRAAGLSPDGISIVDPQRTMRDYAEAGIDVRVTRANYRTGRLEISTYLSPRDFVRYLERQAWRLKSADPETLPLGSFRLQIPGNPNAINAGLASGRFPGVFAPYPIEEIYDLANPDNLLLNKLLTSWLEDDDVEALMAEAYRQIHGDGAADDEEWASRFSNWRESVNMRDYFPHISDTYVDGGAIDNTPSNSAIDAIREWADKEQVSKRDMILDLFVIMLHPEPRLGEDESKDPNMFQIVTRTLGIQGAAKLSSDAVVVDTINHFGERAEELAETLQVLIESLDEDTVKLIEDKILTLGKERGLTRRWRLSDKEPLQGIAEWTENMLANRLPLQVDEVKIHPEEMPLSTLQFTERLGYRQENAINMLTMGCYNTLWALRAHLEEQKNLDDHEQAVLSLAQKWMGFDTWPEDGSEQEQLSDSWACQRASCVYHAHHCLRGANKPL
jgi:hypothetical protein